MLDALRSYRRKLIVQTLAVLANLCFMNKEQMTKHAVKHKTYKLIIDIITNKENKFKKKEDKIYFLGLNCIFYLCLDKKIGTDIYAQNSFFKFLFDLFLEKSQFYNCKQFWVRPKYLQKIAHKNQNQSSTKNTVDDEKKSSTNDHQNGHSQNQNNKASKYNTDEDCRIIVEILRILFNFTLVETNILKFKLDTFPETYQRKVVTRAVELLSVPCNYEPEFDLYCNAKLLALCETPGLISIKIKICNVALYDGDILGMNLKQKSIEPLCHLMEFYCMQTRHTFDSMPQISAMMMFLKAVCRYNLKVRDGIKIYLFGKDADANNEDSESDVDDDEQTTNHKMMSAKNLDQVKDGEESIKNLLIKHCTSVNYSVKRTVADFLFSLCGDDQKEMVRLCGLGNSIGIFVDKGIPGFAGAADKATNLDTLGKLRREKEKKMKEKSKSDKGNKKKKNEDSDKQQSG